MISNPASRPRHFGRAASFGLFLLAVVVWLAANIAAGLLAVAANKIGISIEAVYRSLSTVLLVLAFGFLSLRLHRADALRFQGLARDGYWVRDSWIGIVVGAIPVVVAVAAIAALGSLRFEFNPQPRAFAMLALQFWVLSWAAMAEEVAFRGYPFQRLADSVTPLGAIIVFSLLFGVVHMGNPNVTPVGVLNTALIGVPLAMAYLRTGTLWFPWGIHFGWNFTMGCIAGLPVSGVDFSNAVKGIAVGPTWLTGGAYGIEGSMNGTVAIVLTTLLTYWYTAQRQPLPRTEARPQPVEPQLHSIQPV